MLVISLRLAAGGVSSIPSRQRVSRSVREKGHEMNAMVRLNASDQTEQAGTSAGITIRQATKVYDTANGEKVHALEAVDLDITPGEFVSVVGPSGCGKSTLMMMIAGLVSVTTGEILIDGKLPRSQLGRYARSEERRVGKECVSTGRYRGWR